MELQSFLILVPQHLELQLQLLELSFNQSLLSVVQLQSDLVVLAIKLLEFAALPV